MSLNTDLQHLLQSFVTSTPDVEGAVLVSTDGFPLASALAHGADEDRAAAMGAAALSMGSRIVGELQRGALEQVLIKGRDGYVILVQAGEDTVLEAISTDEGKLGLLLYEIKYTAREIAKLLR
ncbi:MAG: roadblock/LC7 domain-containing protein [Propionibacteriaceae bacterium]|nr:roadblock/LC7 domain-containing protein [Propionibacteriaceae bacterium]